MFVKICGITRIEDADAAVDAGASAVGFVFWPTSPRFIDPFRARRIAAALPPFVTAVGLFVDAPAAEVEVAIDASGITLLQFHGDETPQYCAGFRVPHIKALRVGASIDLVQYAARFHAAKGLLLDAYVDGLVGGTGASFDWRLIPAERPLPLVLSGGLTPQNVTEAIRLVRPWAVDVSSGVESAKGIKDAAKIAAFMQGVRDADL